MLLGLGIHWVIHSIHTCLSSLTSGRTTTVIPYNLNLRSSDFNRQRDTRSFASRSLIAHPTVIRHPSSQWSTSPYFDYLILFFYCVILFKCFIIRIWLERQIPHDHQLLRRSCGLTIALLPIDFRCSIQVYNTYCVIRKV